MTGAPKPCPTCGRCPWPCEACEATETLMETALRDMVIGFLRGYTGPPEVAADELIRMVRSWHQPESVGGTHEVPTT